MTTVTVEEIQPIIVSGAIETRYLTGGPDNAIKLVWGTPAAEAANIIELSGALEDLSGAPFASNAVYLELLVSDSADISDPSDSAVFVAPGSADGALLSGLGTGTVVYRTSSSGTLTIAIQDSTAGSRYIWTKAGSHAQFFVRAAAGVKQITFT